MSTELDDIRMAIDDDTNDHGNNTGKEGVRSSSNPYSDTGNNGGRNASKTGGSGKKSSSRFAKFDKKKRDKVIFWASVTLCLLGIGSCVLTSKIPSLRKAKPGELPVWHWCLLITALLAGHVVSQVLHHLVLFLSERDFSLKENVIYYVVGTIHTAWSVIWCGLILLVWIWLVGWPSNHDKLKGPVQLHGHGNQNEKNLIRTFHNTTHLITITLITILLGSFLWLIKNIFIMMSESSFHIRRFFTRVKTTVRDQYMIMRISSNRHDGTRLPKDVVKLSTGSHIYRTHVCPDPIRKLICERFMGCKRKGTKIIHLKELEQVDEENVSCWGMKILIDFIISKRGTLLYIDEGGEEKHIRSQNDAEDAADAIFSAILMKIKEETSEEHEIIIQRCDDLEGLPGDFRARKDVILQAFGEEEGHQIIQWVHGRADAQDICRESFRRCMMKAWKYRASLVRALEDNKHLFQTLSICVIVVIVTVIIIIWLLMAGVELRKIVFAVGGLIGGSAFIFQETYRRFLAKLIFVFVVHPFDVGDCCLIGDTPVIIQRMHLLKTTALTLDNEERTYPNEYLEKLTIVNFSRSPLDMSDFVVFYLPMKTSGKQINDLKIKIKSYIEDHPLQWQKEHELGMEYMFSPQDFTEKIKLTLRFKHNMMHPHDLRARESRRADLIIQIQDILSYLRLT